MFYTCKLSPMCPFMCGWSSDDSNIECLETDSHLICLLELGLFGLSQSHLENLKHIYNDEKAL